MEVSMLILSRKAGQRIYLGPDITVSILEIGGKFMRVGIEAPDSVCILRGEVKEQIEEENRLAAMQSKHIESLKQAGEYFRLHSRRNEEHVDSVDDKESGDQSDT